MNNAIVGKYVYSIDYYIDGEYQRTVSIPADSPLNAFEQMIQWCEFNNVTPDRIEIKQCRAARNT